MNTSQVKYTLTDCITKESGILPELEKIYVHVFPLWRLVRGDFRSKISGYKSNTTLPNIHIGSILLNIFKSFFSLLRLVLLGRHYSNVFFPHSRLFLVNNHYLERFSDSLIDYSGIGNDYVIFERPQNGTHKKPRYHDEKVVYLDFIEVLVRFCKPLVAPFVRKRYKMQLDNLCRILDFEFEEANVAQYKGLFTRIVTDRLLQYHFIKIVLKRVSPQRIFLAHRSTFDYVIIYAKQRGITSIELQHGITAGESVLYAGKYNPHIDPDYFFVFGASNIGPEFSMPFERMKNVGYAYKNYISSIGLSKLSDNCSLVISEPHISELIVDTLALLAEAYPQYEFHIRCHPQEKLSESIKKKIHLYKNIKVVDNTYESFCALSQYSSVLGENSSVLYEAMSLHKRVGRFNFNGLKVVENELIHGGFKINCIEDFYKFMNTPYSDENDSKELYSDFNIEAFNSIL